MKRRDLAVRWIVSATAISALILFVRLQRLEKPDLHQYSYLANDPVVKMTPEQRKAKLADVAKAIQIPALASHEKPKSIRGHNRSDLPLISGRSVLRVQASPALVPMPPSVSAEQVLKSDSTASNLGQRPEGARLGERDSTPSKQPSRLELIDASERSSTSSSTSNVVSSEDLLDSPQLVKLARTQPVLESKRQQNEQAVPAVGQIRIISGFECSANLKIEQLSNTHFIVRYADKRGSLNNYFLFRVEGASGKTVRIDFEDAAINKWWSLNPVYSYVTDLSDPANFLSNQVADPKPQIHAHNGPLLPDTSGEKWHFMPNVWSGARTPKGTLSMVHTFEQDAYVALKVPYTPSMDQRLSRRLTERSSSSSCRIIDIGKIRNEQKLQIIKIGGDDVADKVRPCILMYGREHGTEQDSSRVVEGAIEYLNSNDPHAISLREKFTFLLIPVFDPIGARLSQYDRITYSFNVASPSDEAIEYSRWFQTWIGNGNRLDLVINLHNIESAEGSHFYSAYLDPLHLMDSRRLHARILKGLMTDHLYICQTNAVPGFLGSRLSGWLSETYGSTCLMSEVNSQEQHRHLNLVQTKKIGQVIVMSSCSYLSSDDGLKMMQSIDVFRLARLDRLRRQGLVGGSALEQERRISWYADSGATSGSELLHYQHGESEAK